jgi:hypothetical protein
LELLADSDASRSIGLDKVQQLLAYALNPVFRLNPNASVVEKVKDAEVVCFYGSDDGFEGLYC